MSPEKSAASATYSIREHVVFIIGSTAMIRVMGCFFSKRELATISSKVRPRRLSQTLLEESEMSGQTQTQQIEQRQSLDVSMVPSGNRRASYFSQDIDPRTYIEDYALSTLNGLDGGREKTNQDRVLVHVSKDCCIFGVFDGHGKNGHHCSSFLKENMASVCIKHLHSHENTSDAMRDCFQELEDGMIHNGFDCKFSGTTVTVVLVTNGKLYVAWVGDSPGFIIANHDKHDKKARDLISIHNFEDSTEAARVSRAGGKIARFNDVNNFIGPLRAFFPSSSIPGLAMSRSLGDTMSKKIGIISVPDTRIQSLDENDQFIFLCSDGLTEFLTSDNIVSELASGNNLKDVCISLSYEAQERWKKEEAQSSDDISCVAIQLCTL